VANEIVWANEQVLWVLPQRHIRDSVIREGKRRPRRTCHAAMVRGGDTESRYVGRVDSGSFEVVFICTGNRFRSAIGEAMFQRLTEGLPVRTTSAGTLDLGPVGVLPEALELAPSLDLDLSRHRARCVQNVDMSDADLVLGFEYHHLSAAVLDANARRERTFTVPELVSLLEHEAPASDGVDPIAHAREAVRRADRARSRGLRPEVADPLGGPPEVFRTTALEIQDLTGRLAALLFGALNEPAGREKE
jgi:protein-tyrosine phosphatase